MKSNIKCFVFPKTVRTQLVETLILSSTSKEMAQTVDYKKSINKQIAVGFLLIGALGSALWFLVPDTIPGRRVEYTLSWLAVFAMPVFLGIHPMLFRRYNDPELIKGYKSSVDASFDRAYLTNAVEQTAVNVLTAVTLGMVAPISLMKLVSIQALIYLIGRVWYYFSYRAAPMKRFTSFVLGYYVAVISLFLSIYFVMCNLY